MQELEEARAYQGASFWSGTENTFESVNNNWYLIKS